MAIIHDITTDWRGVHSVKVESSPFGGDTGEAAWVDQSELCCGPFEIVIADGKNVPFYVWNHGTPFEELKPRVAQCRTCGTLFTAEFRFEEVE